eukprot:5440399-Alexandrium_andersonii.AAC.1
MPGACAGPKPAASPPPKFRLKGAAYSGTSPKRPTQRLDRGQPGRRSCVPALSQGYGHVGTCAHARAHLSTARARVGPADAVGGVQGARGRAEKPRQASCNR